MTSHLAMRVAMGRTPRFLSWLADRTALPPLTTVADTSRAASPASGPYLHSRLITDMMHIPHVTGNSASSTISPLGGPALLGGLACSALEVSGT